MKRRNFLKNIGALAATPALPLKLFAAPLPVSAAQYAKAVQWAGLWVHSTAATYKNMLGVDKSVGEAVFKRLQADGVVGAVDASGIARAAVSDTELSQVAVRLKQTLAPKSASLGASVKASTAEAPASSAQGSTNSTKLDVPKVSDRDKAADQTVEVVTRDDEAQADDPSHAELSSVDPSDEIDAHNLEHLPDADHSA